MKANRRVSKKMSVIATNSARFGAILGGFSLMAIFYLLSASSCTQLTNEQGRLERELAKLEESLRQESQRWENLKTPESIEAAIARCGLKMTFPRHDQYIYVNANGAPYPNQLALTRLRQRAATAATAQYSPRPSRVARRVR
jgi:hypothetical protein